MQGDSFACNNRKSPMRLRLILAVLGCALLAIPAARAQAPSFNLIPELVSKTPEEKEREERQQKAYKDSLRKIPDAKSASDPWGNVRSEASKPAPAKPAPHARTSRTKTGTSN